MVTFIIARDRDPSTSDVYQLLTQSENAEGDHEQEAPPSDVEKSDTLPDLTGIIPDLASAQKDYSIDNMSMDSIEPFQNPQNFLEADERSDESKSVHYSCSDSIYSTTYETDEEQNSSYTYSYES